MNVIKGLRVWGQHDDATIEQALRARSVGPVIDMALMADAHKGMGVPVGSVIAYYDAVSPSGVGTDIACGVYAVRTELSIQDLQDMCPDSPTIKPLVNRIFDNVEFGVGKTNPEHIDHPIFEQNIGWDALPTYVRDELRQLARQQLGTVGGGNHFVDLLVEETEEAHVWIAVHFGSRGLGYKIAQGFMNLAIGQLFTDKFNENPDGSPIVISLHTDLGQSYWNAMELARDYADIGRRTVIKKVLSLLGNPRVLFTVHNPHNIAARERHMDTDLVIVRKGATPLWPRQLGFVGGSMGDIAVVVEGLNTQESVDTLRSCMHGAGRVMSRTLAAGKWKRVNGKRVRQGGLVNWEEVRKGLWDRGIIVKGGGADEAPQVYRPLADVIGAYTNAFRVLYTLRPIAVMMAPCDMEDPYKD